MEDLNAVRVSVDVKTGDSGHLDGLTFAVKDNIALKGYVSGCGNPRWLDTHGVEGNSAPVIDLLLCHGAHLMAKTIMDELAYSLTGENIHYGTPTNPASPDRIPGGSSSGSASVVAGRIVDFAMGTDTAGSVRVPASYCGLYGIRFTHRLVSSMGIVPLATSLDTPGVLAANSSVFNKTVSVLLAGRPLNSVKPTKLVILKDAFDLTLSDSAKRLAPLIENLSKQFESVENDILDPSLWDELPTIFRQIQAFEAWRDLGSWIEASEPDFGPGVKQRFEIARAATWDEFQAGLTRQAEVSNLMNRRFGPDVVICMPTVPDVAPMRNEDESALEAFRAHSLKLLALSSLTGRPQVTIPQLTNDSSAPLGLSLLGANGSDQHLVDICRSN